MDIYSEDQFNRKDKKQKATSLVEDPTRNNVERKRNSIRMIEVKTDSMTKIVQGRYDSAREA